MEWFSDLVGNDSLKSALAARVTAGTVPHALLILGESGSGKKTLVRELAAALNCEKRSAGIPLPCHSCNTCRRILSGQFTDVKTLGKAPGKATVGVDDVREFREDMFLSATESAYKIYIFEDADAMTPQAQNALLKVLEEPPAGVMMFLLARSQDKILTTVRSRTQILRMERLQEEDIRKILATDVHAAITLRRDPDAVRALLLAADGNAGRAIALADPRATQELEQRRRTTLNVLDALCGKLSYAGVRDAVFALPDKRTDFPDMAEEVLTALRDLLLIRRDENAVPLFFTDKNDITRYTSQIPVGRLYAAFDIFNQAAASCRANANMNLLLTGIAADLCRR